MSKGEFSVVAILKEPEAVVRRFVRWYRHIGASKIHLFFDDPLDKSAAIFANDSDVTVTLCDNDFWKKLSFSPDRRFTRRQNKIYNYQIAHCDTPWVLFVDGDEFMYFGNTKVSDYLASVDETVASVSVRTAELMPNITEEPEFLFRVPTPRPVTKRIYGPDMRLFRKRFGLVGHVSGKSFVRTDADTVYIRQHRTEFEDKTLQEIVLYPDSGTYLLHFICDNFESWQRKVKWRRGSSGFPNHISFAIDTALDSEGDDLLRDLYQRLHEPKADVLARMDEAGGLVRLRIPELAHQS